MKIHYYGHKVQLSFVKKNSNTRPILSTMSLVSCHTLKVDKKIEKEKKTGLTQQASLPPIIIRI